MKNKYFTAGVLFAVFITASSIYTLSLALESNFNIILIGLGLGIGGGALFALLLKLFTKSIQQKTFLSKTDLGKDEIIIKEGLANHFKKIEAVGGKLFLTNEKLIFISHKGNIQNHRKDFILKTIRSVNTYKTFGFINNGLKIKTFEKTEKFVVENSTEWEKKINEQRNIYN